jgi:hypothetical protein
MSALPSRHLLSFIFVDACYRLIINFSYFFRPFRPNNKSFFPLSLQFIQLALVVAHAIELNVKNNCQADKTIVYWINVQLILFVIDFIMKFRSPSKSKHVKNFWANSQPKIIVHNIFRSLQEFTSKIHRHNHLHIAVLMQTIQILKRDTQLPLPRVSRQMSK